MALDASVRAVRARAIPVPGNDIDTDRIMPARYLKCVTFKDLGRYVFQDERFDEGGSAKHHPFNDPRYRGAGILVVNKNFGCGSSREHAPQGLWRWGIKAVVGESFAEIFAGNCVAIGLPVVVAQEADVRNLMRFIEDDPACEVSVSVETREVSYGDFSVPAQILESSRKMFLEGTWDSTATLLAAEAQTREIAQKIPYLARDVR